MDRIQKKQPRHRRSRRRRSEREGGGALSHDINNYACPARHPYGNCICDEMRMLSHTNALERHTEALRQADNGKDEEIARLRAELDAANKMAEDAEKVVEAARRYVAFTSIGEALAAYDAARAATNAGGALEKP